MWQRTQLTGTNRSIGFWLTLISLLTLAVHSLQLSKTCEKHVQNTCKTCTEQGAPIRHPKEYPFLVAIARGPHPIPSRTRKLRLSAPMILHLKVWESRSLPGRDYPYHKVTAPERESSGWGRGRKRNHWFAFFCLPAGRSGLLTPRSTFASQPWFGALTFRAARILATPRPFRVS